MSNADPAPAALSPSMPLPPSPPRPVLLALAALTGDSIPALLVGDSIPPVPAPGDADIISPDGVVIIPPPPVPPAASAFVRGGDMGSATLLLLLPLAPACGTAMLAMPPAVTCIALIGVVGVWNIGVEADDDIRSEVEKVAVSLDGARS